MFYSTSKIIAKLLFVVNICVICSSLYTNNLNMSCKYCHFHHYNSFIYKLPLDNLLYPLLFNQYGNLCFSYRINGYATPIMVNFLNSSPPAYFILDTDIILKELRITLPIRSSLFGFLALLNLMTRKELTLPKTFFSNAKR